MSPIESKIVTSLVDKFKLLMNIDEWIVHMRFKHFTASTQNQWDVQGMHDTDL